MYKVPIIIITIGIDTKFIRSVLVYPFKLLKINKLIFIFYFNFVLSIKLVIKKIIYYILLKKIHNMEESVIKIYFIFLHF